MVWWGLFGACSLYNCPLSLKLSRYILGTSLTLVRVAVALVIALHLPQFSYLLNLMFVALVQFVGNMCRGGQDSGRLALHF